ncbi:beta-lactamase [Novosphingobium malaysiense]|uniref:Beta-lactamase n=1 Tax=Novosphingobium malaysiense TaxID=1348853 RepID=A0A0B1ZRN7_9SPHN|nr:beta-lactamase [Novosphingobium malaysiense]
MLAASAASAQAQPAAAETFTTADLAQACSGKDGWLDPAPPAHVFGNTWYVGTCGIAAILITGEDGHVLIDGGMPDAAPLVLSNIARLGLQPKDVRWIVSSHEHFDHVGALAALQKATGAKIAALRPAAALLESGEPSLDDPQHDITDGFAPVAVDKVLEDGDSVVAGNLAVTAHATPVHSPGSTSWTWQSCTADFTCRMIAYADSATTISADAYRFSDHPDRVAQIDLGLEQIGALPCDVLLTPHPSASGMMPRFAGKAPLVAASACTDYAATARKRIEDRLAKEAGTETP